ncbi:hypothetical protein ACLB2K_051770 [Fragaria x ananassa]
MFSTERNLVVSRAIQCELPSDVVLPETEIRRGDEIILMVPHQIKVLKAIRTLPPPLVWCCNRNPEGATLATTWLDTLPAWASKSMRSQTFFGVTLPGVPVSVIVVDVSLCLFGEAAMPLAGIMADLLGSVSTSQVDIDSDTWESMVRYVHEPTSIPATKESIGSLEYLRLEDLEEDVIRQASPCVICLEQLDHSDADQQMVIADDQLRMITRLLCSHLYHRACIVGWLEKSHLCPLCQYPLEPEATKSS